MSPVEDRITFERIYEVSFMKHNNTRPWRTIENPARCPASIAQYNAILVQFQIAIKEIGTEERCWIFGR